MKKLYDKINGKEVYLYTIKNGNIEVDICEVGARINALRVNGVDIVLGFNSVEDYNKSGCYAGATIGRVANRIAKGGAQNSRRRARPILYLFIWVRTTGDTACLWTAIRCPKAQCFTAHTHYAKANYPQAKIICGTLLLGYIEDRGEQKQRGMLPYYAQEFNNAIKLAAENEGCLVADLAAYNLQYETLDYCHPTKEEHKTLAELWLKELKKLI